MTESRKGIAIIPARGGSKGIPRKTIRPLAGRPMIYYAIHACLSARGVDRVVVSTDDNEIALLAQRFGADVLMRDPALADDKSTLDPVIVAAVEQAEKTFAEQYQYVITVQPTSPLIWPSDIERARALLEKPRVDTVLSVVDDRHLCWTIRNGKPVPAYEARLNRQQLPANFRETGAVIACHREQLRRGTRIGAEVELLEMPQMRSFDIDSIADLCLCESILKRKRIVFTVVGYAAVGLGHAFRAVLLAHELVHYDLHFVCERRSELAAAHISKFNYPVTLCEDGALAETVLALQPDIVINDILDTMEGFMKDLRRGHARLVNFEDLGPGAALADLVINALYPAQTKSRRILTGPQYFCLRDEFLFAPAAPAPGAQVRLLVTFGGVDEGNLTARVLDLILPVCRQHEVEIDIITGPGYQHKAELDQVLKRHQYDRAHFHGSTSRISDFMHQADAAITSGGRTVLELAALRVPTMVICQNQRETTHTYACWENGVMNLGFRGEVEDAAIVEQASCLLTDAAMRDAMRAKTARLELASGKQRVISAITSLVEK